MRIFPNLLSLPNSLLLLIAASPSTTTAEPQWPYNLPANIKYYPEEEVHIKRDIAIRERLGFQTPAGVRKMTDDEGEKFFLDYWSFDNYKVDGIEIAPDRNIRIRSEEVRSKRKQAETEHWNETVAEDLFAPFKLHSDQQSELPPLFRFLPRGILDSRDFQCPAGTNSCSSIGRPNSCCATDETCVIVTDTGLGDVGCCPQGSTCGGSVSSCDTADGYTSCPDSSNGGCCIPGYSCDDVGCIISGTTTTTTTAPVVTVTGSPSSVSSTPSSTPASTSAVVPATTTSPTPSSSASLTCSTDYQSCPASLGGGCCPSTRACGSIDCPPISATSTEASPSSTEASETPGAPVRPTSDVTTITSVVGGSTITSTADIGCPTGYYMCSAFYRGCCRVGRNCDSTSCPAAESTSVIVSNGVTIIVPGGATTGGQSGVYTTVITSGGSTMTMTSTIGSQGNCASGWSTCGSDVGGGCCPAGYSCGTSCTATVAGETSEVGKIAPSAGSSLMLGRGWNWVLLGLAVVSGFGILFL